MAIVYYDFSAATNGTGASPASPKNTYATPGNGDVLRLKRGTTWARASQVNFSTFTGLTIEAYYNADGTDDPSQPMPIVTHTAASTFAWNFQGDGIHKIRSIWFKDCSTNANGGVVGSGLVAATSANAQLDIQFCKFTGISDNAIRLSGTGAASAPTFKCLHTVFDDIGEDCIYGGALVFEVGHCRMTNISARSETGDGVGFLGTDPTLAWVHDNYIDHSSRPFKHCVIIDTATTDAGYSVIEDNVLIGSTGNGADNTTAVNGDGKMVIRRNRIVSGRVAVNIAGNATVCSDNLIEIAEADSGASVVAIAASNCSFTGNTVVSTYDMDAAQKVVVQASGESGNDIKNNAFIGLGIAIKSDAVGNPTCTNNAFWQVAAERIDSGGSPFAGGDDITTDPLLTTDYKPTASSPLLGAGTHISYTRDLEGKQRPNPPSIGAYDVATLRPVLTSDPA